MEDVLTRVSRLDRPKLLVRTARHGLGDYNRVVHLRRLLGVLSPPGPRQALLRLMEIEAMADEQRKAQRAEYSVARHIELITAIMCEAGILKAASRAPLRLAKGHEPDPLT